MRPKLLKAMLTVLLVLGLLLPGCAIFPIVPEGSAYRTQALANWRKRGKVGAVKAGAK